MTRSPVERPSEAPPLDTARLTLRGHRREDFAESAAMWGDARVTRQQVDFRPMETTSYEGGCHCGALSVRYTTALEPRGWSIRSCSCSFCTRHGARYTSDPQGRVELLVRDARLARRYTFGTRTADFVLCGSCGVFLCAVAEGRLAVVNVSCLAVTGTPPPTLVSSDDESVEGTRARRARAWTPFHEAAEASA